MVDSSAVRHLACRKCRLRPPTRARKDRLPTSATLINFGQDGHCRRPQCMCVEQELTRKKTTKNMKRDDDDIRTCNVPIANCSTSSEKIQNNHANANQRAPTGVYEHSDKIIRVRTHRTNRKQAKQNTQGFCLKDAKRNICSIDVSKCKDKNSSPSVTDEWGWTSGIVLCGSGVCVCVCVCVCVVGPSGERKRTTSLSETEN